MHFIMVMQIGVKQNEKQLGTVSAIILFSYTLIPLPIGFWDITWFNGLKGMLKWFPLIFLSKKLIKCFVKIDFDKNVN